MWHPLAMVHLPFALCSAAGALDSTREIFVSKGTVIRSRHIPLEVGCQCLQCLVNHTNAPRLPRRTLLQVDDHSLNMINEYDLFIEKKSMLQMIFRPINAFLIINKAMISEDCMHLFQPVEQSVGIRIISLGTDVCNFAKRRYILVQACESISDNSFRALSVIVL